MEQIIVKRTNGTDLPLFNQEPLRTATKAEQRRSMMNEDFLSVTVETVESIDFRIGDSIMFGSTIYKLNTVPPVTKLSERNLEYELQFESPQYDLRRVRFLSEDVTGFSLGSTFDLTGELSLFINVILNNMNRRYPGMWQRGLIDVSETKTLSFSEQNCLAALQTICKAFGKEFEIISLTNGGFYLNVQNIGRVLPHVFEYGRPGGLYQLQRLKSEKEIVNIVYPFGSSKNLKPGYRSFSQRLKIGDPDFLLDQASIDAFGPYESSIEFDDIYPHRVGTVSAVDGLLSFYDVQMDFNLNEKEGENTKYLIKDRKAKITFNTGTLTGREFELEKFDFASKKFTIIENKDENGMSFPNNSGAFQIMVGDKYVITDIIMPDSYVVEAEALLRTRGQVYLDQNKILKLPYALNISEAYLIDIVGELDNNVYNHFELGDYIKIRDFDLNVDDSSRVMSFVRDMIRHNNYQLTIADNYTITTIERIVADNIEFNNIIRLNDLKNPAVQKQAWLSAQEAVNRVFDSEGYFVDGKIRATSIEAILALIGTNEGQFQMINCTFQPNYGGRLQAGSYNVIRFVGGSLVHLTVEDTPRTWMMQTRTTTFSDNAFRYVYAKCHKTNYSDGQVIYSTVGIKTKEDPNYYHFPIGTLSTVDNVTQTRKLNLSYGFTEINGRWITTGRLQSSDGFTYFDLDTGIIGGKIIFKASNGEDVYVSAIYDEQKSFAETVGKAIEGLDGIIDTWFYAGVPTLSNAPALNWTTTAMRDDHVNDLYYDTTTNKSYRFVKQANVFSWQIVNEADISAAMAAAAKAQDTADGKRRVFKVTPYPPYDIGDLWTDGQELRVARVAKPSLGQYSPSDWEKATYYDSTQVVIDQGVVTAGGVYLAGDGTIKAGITGNGGSDSSIRIWAGASYDNRGFAPFRVTQGGEVYARKRIEMMNENNNGQAGICGSNSAGDGTIRFWAGTNYENRANALFRVYADGTIISGSWIIGSAGIQNVDGNGVFIAASGVGSAVTKAIIGANAVSSASGVSAAAYFSSKRGFGANNVGAIFEASGGTENYAFQAIAGIGLVNESLINGKRSYYSNNTGLTDYVDPSLYDFICINGFKNGNVSPAIKLNPPSRPITNGKEIQILQINNGVTLYLIDTVHGDSSWDILGGGVVTLTYAQGLWVVNAFYDNTY